YCSNYKFGKEQIVMKNTNVKDRKNRKSVSNGIENIPLEQLIDTLQKNLNDPNVQLIWILWRPKSCKNVSEIIQKRLKYKKLNQTNLTLHSWFWLGLVFEPMFRVLNYGIALGKKLN